MAEVYGFTEEAMRRAVRILRRSQSALFSQYLRRGNPRVQPTRAFPAMLKAVDGEPYYDAATDSYSWRRQGPLPEGKWEDDPSELKIAGRNRGADAHDWAAFELNKVMVAPEFTVVWMWPGAQDDGYLQHSMLFEYRPEFKFFRIYARSGKRYSGKEQEALDSGEWDDKSGGLDTTQIYEINFSSGNWNVSTRKRVLAWVVRRNSDGTPKEWRCDCGLTDEDPGLRYVINPPSAC